MPLPSTPTSAPGAQGSPYAGTANEGNISSWAGPYVTGMLGQAQAVANMPYQTYQGPLTAGPSSLQQNLFQGLGGLDLPQNYGQSFSSSGAYQAPSTGGSQYGLQPIGTGQDGTGTQVAGGQGGIGSLAGQPTQASQSSGTPGIASQYMNPYLQNVLDPQLAELRRQNDITQQKTNAGLTSQGAFGGGRQAIMNSENNRNMLQEMNKTIGAGYSNAFNNAQNQFNTEQTQGQNLANTIANIGGQQQALNQAGVTADYNEFLNQRNYPQQQLQFQQSMLSGLPISTTSNIPVSLTPAQQVVGGMTDISALLNQLGLMPSTTTPKA